MNRILSIKDFNEINSVINIIHDCWFSIEEISFLEEKSLLQFYIYEKRWRFLFSKKLKKRGLIKISNAISYEISESENIGIYDINTILFDNAKNSLTILTNIPLYFSINVYSFSISVEIED